MPKKPKLPQAETPGVAQERDLFQTPKFATDIIIPFLPSCCSVWEPMAGEGRISNRLSESGMYVLPTDIRTTGNDIFKYDPVDDGIAIDVVVTNPAFSIKRKVFDRLMFLGYPFAILIPADWTGWSWRAVFEQGCKVVIPDGRIPFITPNMIDLVQKKTGVKYKSVDDIPNEVMQRCSSPMFHSWWLCHGIKGLRKKFNGVNLPQDLEF